MELPNLFVSRRETDQPRLVICVVLTEKLVQANLLSLRPSVGALLTSSQPFFYENDKQLTDKTDESLQELGPESESVAEVIFCFDQSWLVDDDVLEDKKPLLKKVVEDLSLQPVGFMTLTDAIYEQLLQTDPQLSILLAFLTTDNLVLSVFRRGKQLCQEMVGRSSTFSDDLTETLARISQICGAEENSLPNALLLASLELPDEQLSKLQQVIIDYDWSQQTLLLQTPTCQILNSQALIQHIANQGIMVLQQQFYAPKARVMAGASIATASDLELEQNKSASDLEVETATESELNEEVEGGADLSQQTTASTFGVPISTDLTKQENNNLRPVNQSEIAVGSSLLVGAGDTQGTQLSSVAEANVSVAKATIEPVGKVGRFKSFLKRNWQIPPGKSLRPYVILGLILGTVALFIFGYLYLRSASSITIQVEPETGQISREIQVTLDETAKEADPETMLLPAEPVTETIETSGFTQTSGEAKVGEVASGQVKIVNKTEQEKIFEAGTKLITDGDADLTFELDESVTVPAAKVTSDADGETKEYGDASVKAKAVAIGEEGNVASGTKLLVEDFDASSYTASITETFTGGVSRDVQVVTEEDMTRLLAEVNEAVATQAVELFKEKADQGQLISPPTETVVTKKTYSAKVGEEATQLDLNVTAEVTALAYNADDVLPLARTYLGQELDEGLMLTDDEIQILTKFDDSQDLKSGVVLVANVSATTVPKLDEQLLKQQVAGREINEAQSMLEQIDGVSTVTINFSPNLARKLVSKLSKETSQFQLLIL